MPRLINLPEELEDAIEQERIKRKYKSWTKMLLTLANERLEQLNHKPAALPVWGKTRSTPANLGNIIRIHEYPIVEGDSNGQDIFDCRGMRGEVIGISGETILAEMDNGTELSLQPEHYVIEKQG